jgi:hypothetical protein
MFVGPCIVLYFYSKTNQMHNISNLFYFGTLYMFWMVSPSIRSLRLYIQNHTIQVLWLLASIPDAVCTVSDSWRWTERLSETCRVLFQNKPNLRYCASGWFHYRKVFLQYFTAFQAYLNDQGTAAREGEITRVCVSWQFMVTTNKALY